MFIPTQEERYSKRTLMTLVLCVIGPCLVYGYVHADKMPFPVDSLLGMLNILLFFNYPLALLSMKLGVPALEWDIQMGGVIRTLELGGVFCSLAVHIVLIAVIYKSKISPKMALTLAITIGFTDLLACKLINSFAA